MRNFKIKIFLVLGLLSAFACEDYLDIAPESVLTEEEVFSTFNNAQGFVEEMYAMVVPYGTAGHSWQDYDMGDDVFDDFSSKFSTKVDQGDLGNWISQQYSFLALNSQGSTSTGNTSSTDARQRPRLWQASLQGIRKANIVIANEKLMVGLSQEEKNVILGQAYFFRAFFHNEIMKYWGRFPHITEVYTGTITTPRPETYKESALAVNEDYKKAIELLPVNWDNEPYGKRTLGNNAGRVTKGAAYAYQGKNLLFAASPLMFSNNSSGIDTYTYDKELAAMAADAFAGVLKLDGSRYEFATWDNYEAVFWRTPTTRTWPGLSSGAKEFIFAASAGANDSQIRSFMSCGIPRDVSSEGQSVASPTHNFIYNNFGMKNGLSIEDDLSGAYGTPTYNPAKPFSNRDPRLYKWVILDKEVISTRAGVPAANRVWKLYSEDVNKVTGTHRKKDNSRTGYLFKKFYPVVAGQFHVRVGNNIIGNYLGMLLQMRLTDAYLMYAEALHVAKGATTAPSSFSMTAEQVINKIRNRAGISNVPAAIVSDNNKFLDEIRRQRAMELCFEGQRWTDIRRWGVAHLDKYKNKTELLFDQNYTFFKEAKLVSRVCEYPKHYWLPFEANQTQFYKGFPQNPGW